MIALSSHVLLQQRFLCDHS